MLTPVRALIAALCTAAASVVSAAPTLITFEDITSFSAPSITSFGYTFTPSSGTLSSLTNANCGVAPCSGNNTNTLYVPQSGAITPNSGAPVTLANAGGSSFILGGLDYAEFLVDPAVIRFNAVSLLLTGHLQGGGTVTQTLQLDGIVDGPNGVNDYQSAVLSAFWSTSLLTSLDISGMNAAGAIDGAFALDNILVDVPGRLLPEPGSLLLAGMALLGMLGASRRGFKPH